MLMLNSQQISFNDNYYFLFSGQVKVSAYMNFGLLTVHVIQGRQLSTKWKNSCDSFVKVSLSYFGLIHLIFRMF